jgi:plasmid maintenance system antidote protein VapI
MVQAAIGLDPELLTTLQLRYNLTLATRKPEFRKRLKEIRRAVEQDKK